MPRKKTQEEFEAEVYNLVGDEYTVLGEYTLASNKILLRHNVCSHEYSVTPSNFFSGRRCGFCSVRIAHEKRKFTIEQVKDKISKVSPNTEVIGDYTGSAKNGSFRCKVCGHEWQTKFNNIFAGHGCPVCGKKKSNDAKRLSDKEFKERVKRIHEGRITCLENYKGRNDIDHGFRCNVCGKVWQARPANVFAGKGCPKCHHTKLGLMLRITKEDALRQIAKKAPNTELISEITTTEEKARFRCKKCGNKWEAPLGHVLMGRQCAICAVEIRKEKLRFSQEEFEQKLSEKRDGTISTKDEYVNAHTKMTFQCSECGGSWKTAPFNIINGNTGCPECARHVSLKEKEVRAFVKSLGFEPVYNTREIIPPKELDIYIPERKVAIEFNGNYWHGDNLTDKDYHYKKSTECEALGIRLIHIFEYEWDNPRQRPILENIIRHALGFTEREIYARKCKLEERSSASMREFFEKNNIQGFRGGQRAVCLVYEGEVVMSYIVGKCFFHKSPSYEIIRGATKLGYTVVGGASKLWNYITAKWNDLPILYYIDYNYFNGGSMSSLKGLQFATTTSSFKNFWIRHWRTGEENVIKNREPMYHHQVMQAQAEGWGWPIYNAGTKTYIYYPNQTEGAILSSTSKTEEV